MRKKITLVCFLISAIFLVSPAGACSLSGNSNFKSGLFGWQQSFGNISGKGRWADIDFSGGLQQAGRGHTDFFYANPDLDFSMDSGTSIFKSLDDSFEVSKRFGRKKGNHFAAGPFGGNYFNNFFRHNADKHRHGTDTIILGWLHFGHFFFLDEDMDSSIMSELNNLKALLESAIELIDSIKITINDGGSPVATPVPPTLLLFMSGVIGLFTAKKKLVNG
jgi:hypothetical protein